MFKSIYRAIYKPFHNPAYKPIYTSLLCLIAIFCSANTVAETYKCETEGKVSFQSRPCHSGQQTLIDEAKPAEESIDNIIHEEDGISIGKFIVKFDHDLPNGKLFVYKVEVTNNSNFEADLNLTYRCVDREGFFVKNANANGVVPANSKAVLTNQIYLSQREHTRMHKWLFVRHRVSNRHARDQSAAKVLQPTLIIEQPEAVTP